MTPVTKTAALSSAGLAILMLSRARKSADSAYQTSTLRLIPLRSATHPAMSRPTKGESHSACWACPKCACKQAMRCALWRAPSALT